MKFGKRFLGLKALSLGIRSLVFLGVLSLTDIAFGPNTLLSFLSWVTVVGIALGFGASDSMTVSSDEQVAKVSRSVYMLSLVGVGAISLLFVGSYWINVAITCFNYGLSFWNLGLIRRRNPFLFEQIANYQMLFVWSTYLIFLYLETSDLKVLSALYAVMNGVLSIIALKNNCSKLNFAQVTQDRSLKQVSVNKLVWEINYSALTRMPFLLQGLSTSIHSIFSYGYFLFEMSSAILSHYQTVFLNSRKVNMIGWIRLCSVLLAINITLLLSLVVMVHFQNLIIDQFAYILGIKFQGIIMPLSYTDMSGLMIFMLAITALQSTAFGRYAIKLEANVRVSIIATSLTVIVFSLAWIFSNYLNFGIYPPLVMMFIVGVFLMWIVYNNASNKYWRNKNL